MSKPREYRGDDVVVSFDERRCIHSAKCVQGLPEVFDPNRRPWIEPDAAQAERVLEVVATCPSGALKAHRPGQPAEEASAGSEVPVIMVAPDGPLLVDGPVRLRLASGEERIERRLALCRCGHSRQKPVCDGSHGPAGFEDPSEA
jgi:uncharacterized Fe-S cluster protein YjdI